MGERICENLALSCTRRYVRIRGSPPVFVPVVTQLVTQALTRASPGRVPWSKGSLGSSRSSKWLDGSA